MKTPTLEKFVKIYNARNKTNRRYNLIGILSRDGFDFLTDGFSTLAIENGDPGKETEDTPSIKIILDERGKSTGSFTVNRKQLAKAIDQAAVFARENNRAVLLHPSDDRQSLYVFGNSPETGHGYRTIPATFSGYGCWLAVDYKVIGTVLDYFADCETVTIDTRRNDTPIFIKHGERIAAAMPMKVTDLAEELRRALLAEPFTAQPSAVWRPVLVGREQQTVEKVYDIGPLSKYSQPREGSFEFAVEPEFQAIDLPVNPHSDKTTKHAEIKLTPRKITKF